MNARRVAYTAPRTLAQEAGTATAPPPRGHVAIDAAHTGICGTDLHIFHGSMDARVGPPQVIGHEMSGRVAAAAPDVTGWEAGDNVAVMPLVPCGQCPACHSGQWKLLRCAT